MIIKATFKSLLLLKSSAFLKLAILSIAITLLALLGFISAVTIIIGNIEFTSNIWLEWLINGIASIGSGLIGWLLFPTLTPLIANLLSDKVAKIIEKNDHPNARVETNKQLTYNIAQDLLLVAKNLTLNILFLPLYLIPFVNILAYYLLNSYLLGREFFEMSATRYVGRKNAKNLRKKLRIRVLIAGFIISIMSTTPLVGLVMPLFATSIMTYLFLDYKSTKNT